MARARNFGAVILVGASLLERPPAVGLQRGTLFVNETTGEEYAVVLAGGVHAWIATSSTAGLSSKYWVNAPGSLPSTGYTTVSSAVAAAVADGHNDTNPAAIMIMQGGIFTEDVTLPAGISLQGVVDGVSTNAAIVGTITFTGTAGTNLISNLFIFGSLLVQGAASQPITISCSDVIVFGNTNHAVVFNANDVTFNAENSNFSADTGKIGIRCDSGGSGFSGELKRCKIKGNGATGMALQMVGSTWSFTDCELSVTGVSPSIVQSFSNVDQWVANFYNCHFTTNNAATTNIFNENTASASEVRIYGGGTWFEGFPATVTLGGGASTPTLIAGDGVNLGAFQVANLPTLTVPLGTAKAWGIDGRKVGEPPAGGTGVPLYYNPPTNSWFVFSTDTVVAA